MSAGALKDAIHISGSWKSPRPRVESKTPQTVSGTRASNFPEAAPIMRPNAGATHAATAILRTQDNNIMEGKSDLARCAHWRARQFLSPISGYYHPKTPQKIRFTGFRFRRWSFCNNPQAE
jgi:hypothetical protein